MIDQTTSRENKTQITASREDIYEVICDTLRDGVVMTLATSTNNQPWTCNLLYSFDEELNMYWLSKENARHSTDLTHNPKVSANVCVVESSGHGRVLQMEGMAYLTDNNAMRMMIEEKYHERHKDFKHKTSQELIDEAKYFKLYRFTPAKILSTHEHLWGHARQEYTP